MKLLTKELIRKIPMHYSQEEVEDPICVVKFFCPWSNWTWYVIEGEQQENEDWLFFGYTIGLYNEMGYFCLSELEDIIGPAGLKLERDMYFIPKPISEIKKLHGETAKEGTYN